MSGYSSKAAVVEVVKATIAADHNRTGLSTDPADYNIAGIVRECFYNSGAYGWRSTDADFVASLRTNLRKRAATVRPEVPRKQETDRAEDSADTLAEDAAPDTAAEGPTDRTDSAPTIGDRVRIYGRSRWYDENGAEQRARTLQPGEWTILGENRHGDWIVSNRPGTSHHVFRGDVEHIPAEDAGPQLETPAALAGVAPLATSVAHTADGTFTTRVYPGVSADTVTVVTNLGSDGYDEPHGTSLEPGETTQDLADYRARGWVRARGPIA